MEPSDEPDEQEIAWETLYGRVVATMARFGTEDPFGRGDYLIVDDNYGWTQQKIELQNLEMLRPDIVAALRDLLAGFPDWEIVMAVDVPGQEAAWPRMGVTIRGHEVIDGLQREYLPEPFRVFTYKDSRPGTGND